MLLRDLFESFNTVVPYEWHDRSNDDMRLLQAEFMIGDGHYIVEFKNLYYNPGWWTLSFVRNADLELSGTGSASTVISTVLNIARKFLATVQPRNLVFAGKTDDQSRTRLYPRLLAMALREFPNYEQRDTRSLGGRMSPRYNEYRIEKIA